MKKTMIIIISLLVIAIIVIIMVTFSSNDTNQSARYVDPSKAFSDQKIVNFINNIESGNSKVVKEAISQGIDVNTVGKDGFRPIFFAFTDNGDVLKILLDAHADPNAKLSNNNSVLHFAVQLSNPIFTSLLLTAGADPNAKGENEKLIIHEALGSDSPEVISLLVKAGANINAVWGGDTPLTAAIATYHWEIATRLVDLNADVNFKNQAGKSAIDRLCNYVGKAFPTPSNQKGTKLLLDAFKRRNIIVPCEIEVNKLDQQDIK